MTNPEPWSAERLTDGQVQFTNTYGSRLVAVTLSPIGNSKVAVVGYEIDPEAVDRPVEAGASFTATVRGAGVRIMATDPERHRHLPWEFYA